MIAPVDINGEMALVLVSRGVLRITQIGANADRVARVWFHSNPDKLTRVNLPEGFRPAD